jgi:hypothetical protein
VAWLEEAGSHAGALSHLADEDDWPGWGEVFEAGLDLVHGDVDTAGDVACSELGRGADVDDLGVGWLVGQVGDGDGWGQISSY